MTATSKHLILVAARFILSSSRAINDTFCLVRASCATTQETVSAVPHTRHATTTILNSISSAPRKLRESLVFPLMSHCWPLLTDPSSYCPTEAFDSARYSKIQRRLEANETPRQRPTSQAVQFRSSDRPANNTWGFLTRGEKLLTSRLLAQQQRN